MDKLIETFQAASTTLQAMAVSLGGLIGVFATLTIFFIIIWTADRIGSRKKG